MGSSGTLKLGVYQRRDGLKLSFHDDTIKAGDSITVVSRASGVVSFLLTDGRLLSLPESDLEIFEFMSQIEQANANTQFLRAMIHGQELILGDALSVRPGMKIVRTSMPFLSIVEHTAPHGDVLTVEGGLDNAVWYQTSGFKVGSFHRRYLTTAYFTIA